MFSAVSEKKKLDKKKRYYVMYQYGQVTYSEPSRSIHAHGLDLFLPRSASKRKGVTKYLRLVREVNIRTG